MRKQKLGAIPMITRITPLNDYKWTLESETTIISKDEILIVNAYYKDNQSPNFRAFFNKNDYITQDFQSPVPTWKTGRLVHYVSYHWWDKSNKGVYIEKKYKDIVTEFIGINDDDVMNVISKFQDGILSETTLRKEKRINDPIDKKMKEIKELPEDFNNWLINDVFLKSKYIFYQYEKKVNLEGYCTHCHKDVKVYKPKHNESGICPHCGSNIIYKSIGKSTQVEDFRKAVVLQKTNEGFVTRYYHIYKRYGKNYRKPKTTITEEYRDFYTKSLSIEPYEYSMFKNKYLRWNQGGEIHYLRYSRNEYHVYPFNVDSILQSTKLQYSSIGALAGNCIDFSFNIDAFIRDYKNGAIYLEHFIKVGLFNLTRDILSSYSKEDINENGKSLNAVLGIENDDIKILKKTNVTMDGLKLFKVARKQGKRLTVEQLSEIMNGYDASRFENIFKYVAVIKALRYLREQPEYISEKEMLYNDYLNSCITLKQDMKNTFVLFPKDLRMAHDVNTELINEKKSKSEYKKHNSKYAAIKKMNKELNNLYFYEDDKFLIRAPEDAAEIVKEGQSLHHCVGGGGYSSRMASASIAILFLRDKENPIVPYYTIEIDRRSNVIQQCHGYRNKDTDKKRIQSFIKKFTRGILNKINQERKAG